MIDKTTIKAIIFDVDGTLRDTDDEMIRSIELFLLRFEYFIASETSRTYARKFVMHMENPAQKVLYYADKWGLDTWVHSAVNGIRGMMNPLKHNHNFQTIEGVKDMIEHLSERYPLAVASAGNEKTVMAFLEHAGIHHHFTCIATALTCPHTKPFADPLIWCANQMNTLPQHCLMVGDTTVDIMAGKNAAMQTVGVLCGFGEAAELEALKADIILETTADLAQLLL